MRNFILLSVLVFILGLFVAFRVQNFSNRNTQLREFGPIRVEVTLEKAPKMTEQFQIIEMENLRIFADIYPSYQSGDVVRIVGEANSEGLVFRPKIEKIGRRRSVLAGLADLRLAISKRVDRLMPLREATLVKGMVLGVDDIEKSFREQLIATGTIHAVVVSGQNLSIVAGFFLVLVKYLDRRVCMSLSLLAVLFYAGLTGFEVPVVRALIMVVLSYLAVFLGRERLAIWNLLFSAILILLIWPEAIFDVSFQLTFAATLGIMTLGQRIIRIFNSPFDFPSTKLRASAQGSSRGFTPRGKPFEKSQGKQLSILRSKTYLFNLLLSNAAVATSAYLFTAPLIFWHFGRTSLIAPLVNVLVAEAVVPIMILGFGVAISSLIFMPFAQVLAYLAYVPAFYFGQVVEVFGR